MKTRQNKTKQNKTKNRNRKYKGGSDPECPICPNCRTKETVKKVSSPDLSVVFCVCTKCHWNNY